MEQSNSFHEEEGETEVEDAAQEPEIQRPITDIEDALQLSADVLERITLLSDIVTPNQDGKYILYWMQHAPRTESNNALELAKVLSRAAELPILIVATISLEKLIGTSKRHLMFALEGIAELEPLLAQSGIRLCFRIEPIYIIDENGEKVPNGTFPMGGTIVGVPELGIKGFAQDAWAIVKDMDFFRADRSATQAVVSKFNCPIVEIDTQLSVPIPIIGGFRFDQLESFLESFLEKAPDFAVQVPSEMTSQVLDDDSDFEHFGYKWPFMEYNWSAYDWLTNESIINDMLERFEIDTEVDSGAYRGGQGAARNLLSVFITRRMKGYERAHQVNGESNRGEYGSLLSPYYAFGFISPIDAIVKLVGSGRSFGDTNACIRSLGMREFAYNVVYHHPNIYDTYEILPESTRKALEEASKSWETFDIAEDDWENAATHDANWNGIQQEIVLNGRNLASDRLYWAQKLLEYSQTPEEGLQRAFRLNRKYMLDSLDPVNYVSIAHSFELALNNKNQDPESDKRKKMMESLLWATLKTAGVENERVCEANSLGPRPSLQEGGTAEYVLCHTSYACRTKHNEALEVAKALANYADLPLVVLATLDLDHFRAGSLRHVQFRLEGIAELEYELSGGGVKVCFRIDPTSHQDPKFETGLSMLGDPSLGIKGFEENAWAIVVDEPYLKYHCKLFDRICAKAKCSVIKVESTMLVPSESLNKNADLETFLQNFPNLCKEYSKILPSQTVKVRCPRNMTLNDYGYIWDFMGDKTWKSQDWIRGKAMLHNVLEANGIPTNLPEPKSRIRGGASSCNRILYDFVTRKLKGYREASEQKGEYNRAEYGSLLSAFISNGFISPVEVAISVMRSGRSMPDIQAFLRNLGKRDYSFLFVKKHLGKYDDFDSVFPEDVKKRFEMVTQRMNKFRYTEEQWETGQTHDILWNEIQKEIVECGRDISLDRQYWCQKFLHYGQDHRETYSLAIRLNDRYMIDGIDAVGYYNIMECFYFLCNSNRYFEVLEKPETIEDAVAKVIEECEIDKRRIRILNGIQPPRLASEGGSSHYILYWMSRAPRTSCNDALEFAKTLANHAQLPLVVLYVIDLNQFVRGSRRHIVFLLEGLNDIEASLAEMGIKFAIRIDPYEESGVSSAPSLLGNDDYCIEGFCERAWAIVTDRSHLRESLSVENYVVENAGCPVIDIETSLIIPVDAIYSGVATDPGEYVELFLENYIDYIQIQAIPQTLNHRMKTDIPLSGIGWRWPVSVSQSSQGTAQYWIKNEDSLIQILNDNNVDTSIAPIAGTYRGGQKAAKKLLNYFVSRRLGGYHSAVLTSGESGRGDYGSLLSPYLAFGFISPSEVALTVEKSDRLQKEITAYIRSLAKRELSFNFTAYVEEYDTYTGAIPVDVREDLAIISEILPRYEHSEDAWEAGAIHDEGWNSIQNEMVTRGKDLVQDRFYWAQKIIEYECDPELAYARTIRLNSKYMIDGLDPIGFRIISECFRITRDLLAAQVDENQLLENSSGQSKNLSQSVPSEVDNSIDLMQDFIADNSFSAIEVTQVETYDEIDVITVVGDAITQSGIDGSRVRLLTDTPIKRPHSAQAKQYVLYWCVRGYHVNLNEAFELSKSIANALELPLVVLVAIDLGKEKRISFRHFNFIFQGLQEFETNVNKTGARFYLRFDPADYCAVNVVGNEEYNIQGFAANAAIIIKDRSHLRDAIESTEYVVSTVSCPLIDVETRLIVPAEAIADELVDDHDDFLNRFLILCDDFVHGLPKQEIKVRYPSGVDCSSCGTNWSDESDNWSVSMWLDSPEFLREVLAGNGVDVSTYASSSGYQGGEHAAEKLVQSFCNKKLKGFKEVIERQGQFLRGEFGSLISPYLTWGFISPTYVARSVLESGASREDITEYFKILGRRELSFSFVLHHPNYDSFECLPNTVKEKLRDKAASRTNHNYSEEDWASGKTHNAKWNTVQQELYFRGRDAVDDRFYWCQKLIDYEKDPSEAYRIALDFNDRFMIDGFDPVGYFVIRGCFAYNASLDVPYGDPADEVTPEEIPGDDSAVEEAVLEILQKTRIQASRVRWLNQKSFQPIDKRDMYILYWATENFYVNQNYALEFAKALSALFEIPLVVLVLLDLNKFAGSSARHVMFFLEGVNVFCNNLAAENIKMDIRIEMPNESKFSVDSLLGSSTSGAVGYIRNAVAVVTDRPHLEFNKACVQVVSSACRCSFFDVETKLLVPLDAFGGNFTDDFEEFLAIYLPFCDEYLEKLEPLKLHKSTTVDTDYLGNLHPVGFPRSAGEWITDDKTLFEILQQSDIDTEISQIRLNHGHGESSANGILEDCFSATEFNHLELTNGLNALIANGFISVSEIGLKVMNRLEDQEKILPVFRHIAQREHFFHLLEARGNIFNSYETAIDENIRNTLATIMQSRKTHTFTEEEIEKGETHNSKWNAIQRDMTLLGLIDEDERLYWFIKLMEMHLDPPHVYEMAFRLNRKYMLDFFDPFWYGYLLNGFNVEQKRMESNSKIIGENINNLAEEILKVCAIEGSRIESINNNGPRLSIREGGNAKYVLYWCRHSIRVRSNESYEVAKCLANLAGLPLVVTVVIDRELLIGRSKKHVLFFLQGLADFRHNLEKDGAKLVFQFVPSFGEDVIDALLPIVGDESRGIQGLEADAWALVMDRTTSQHDSRIRNNLDEWLCFCAAYSVESHLLIPMHIMAEFEIHDMDSFLVNFIENSNIFLCPVTHIKLENDGRHLEMDGYGHIWPFMETLWTESDWLNNSEELDKILTMMGVNIDSHDHVELIGGESRAYELLDGLSNEAIDLDFRSPIIPYLTFGFISVKDVLNAKLNAESTRRNSTSVWRFLGKREYAYFKNAGYVNDTSIDSAISALKVVPRNPSQDGKNFMALLDSGNSRDKIWNSIHLSLRSQSIQPDGFVYWCWGIIKLSGSPEEAFSLSLGLSRKYLLQKWDPFYHLLIEKCFKMIASIYGTREEDKTSHFILDVQSFCEQELSYVNVLTESGPSLDGEYILYWCTNSFRVSQNPSLELAISLANISGLPLVVLCAVDLNFFSQGSSRHLSFLLEGLETMKTGLEAMGATFCFRFEPLDKSDEGSGMQNIMAFSKKAWAIVCDRPHLYYWRNLLLNQVAPRCQKCMLAVESRLLVSVDSDDFAYSEGNTKTIADICREKASILKSRILYNKEPVNWCSDLGYNSGKNVTLENCLKDEALLRKFLESQEVPFLPLSRKRKGGEIEARECLRDFISEKLVGYSCDLEIHGEQNKALYGSSLGPYLSFGFLSSREVLNEVVYSNHDPADVSSFVQSIALREYSYYIVSTSPLEYDEYDIVLNDETKQKLSEILSKRSWDLFYSEQEWIDGQVHDKRWIKIQQEYLTHGETVYGNRLYWCEKIIEFTEDPAVAMKVAIKLNNRMMLDALDPTGYTNIVDVFRGYVSDGPQGYVESYPLDKTPMKTILLNAIDQSKVPETRIRLRNKAPPRPKVRKGSGGLYVLYWSCQAYRCINSSSLNLAKAIGVLVGLPVIFLVTMDFSLFRKGSKRHLMFVMKRLQKLRKTLEAHGIILCIRCDNSSITQTEVEGCSVIGPNSFESRAWSIVCDRPFDPYTTALCSALAMRASCPVIEVENHMLIPVHEFSMIGIVPPYNVFQEKYFRLFSSYAQNLNPVEVPQPKAGLDLTQFGNSWEFEDSSRYSETDWLSDEESFGAVLKLNQIPFDFDAIENLNEMEKDESEIPLDQTSEKLLLSPHLTFGVISSSTAALELLNRNEKELVISEFCQRDYNFLRIRAFINEKENEVSILGMAEHFLPNEIKQTYSGKEHTKEHLSYWLSKHESNEVWTHLNKGFTKNGSLSSSELREWCAYVANNQEDKHMVLSIAVELFCRNALGFTDPHVFLSFIDSFIASVSSDYSPKTVLKDAKPQENQSTVAEDISQTLNNNEAHKTAAPNLAKKDEFSLPSENEIHKVVPRNLDIKDEVSEGTHSPVHKPTTSKNLKSLLKVLIEKCGIETLRIRVLNNKMSESIIETENYVLYWATTSFRTVRNETFEVSKCLANILNVPLVVLVVLDLENLHLESLRQVIFFLEGILDFREKVLAEGISFNFRIEPHSGNSVKQGIPNLNLLGNEKGPVAGFASKAVMIVTDRSHISPMRGLVKKINTSLNVGVIDVESKLIVPLEICSKSLETNFDNFMRKFMKVHERSMSKVPIPQAIEHRSDQVNFEHLGWRYLNLPETMDVAALLQNPDLLFRILSDFNIDLEVQPMSSIRGGHESVHQNIQNLLRDILEGSSSRKRSEQDTTRMILKARMYIFPYMSYGQVSASEFLSAIIRTSTSSEITNRFLIELGLREFSFNHAYYNSQYPTGEGILSRGLFDMINRENSTHETKERPFEAWLFGNSNDPEWDKVHAEIALNGENLEFSRKYWLSFVISQESNPAKAFQVCMLLNNHFSLLCFDPQGYGLVLDTFLRYGQNEEFSNKPSAKNADYVPEFTTGYGYGSQELARTSASDMSKSRRRAPRELEELLASLDYYLADFSDSRRPGYFKVSQSNIGIRHYLD